MLRQSDLAKRALQLIFDKSLNTDVVLLDYNVNDTFIDISRPLAHATLIKLYIERNGVFPKDLYEAKPLTKEESLQLRKMKLGERKERLKNNS